MTELHFYKYSAAGNDYIVLDDQKLDQVMHPKLIRQWCDRHFGVGADGVLLLEPDSHDDYRMVYYNADGTRGEMCGNGARALCAFAKRQGLANQSGTFIADDGKHGYEIMNDQIWIEILVTPTREDVMVEGESAVLLNTGVPHLILPVGAVDKAPVVEQGYRLSRVSAQFPMGTNINFLEIGTDRKRSRVRTFERGVNAETLACGTGATACSIYLADSAQAKYPIDLEFPGGVLTVNFKDNRFWLTGPVELVFEGRLAMNSLRTQIN